MIKISFLGFKYARLILENLKFSQIEELKKRYSYLYIVAYKKTNLKNFEVLSKRTPIIDLTKDIKEIFRKFNATTRNEIRKTKKDENLKFIALDQNFDQIYKLYKNLERTQGRTPIPIQEIKKSKIFSAYFKGELISSISCYDHNKILRIGQIFSLRMKNEEKEFKNTSWTTRRSMFEICKYGKKNGYKKLDLGIVNLTDPAKAGVAKFKQSFGGDIIDTYIYRYESKIFKPLRRILKSAKIINIH